MSSAGSNCAALVALKAGGTVAVFDDFPHHPTEMLGTINGLHRLPEREGHEVAGGASRREAAAA